MKIYKLSSFFLILPLILTLLPETSQAQLVMGQYEDEAPLRTWNTFGFKTAPSLAMGETQFTLAFDSSASLANPALLTDLPKITLTLNSSVETASMFKFSIVNTGVFVTEGNSSLSYLSLDYAGASFRLKNWAFSLSVALLEYYPRPLIDFEYSSMFNAYTLNFDQEGVLKNINFSVARRLFGKISLGIGVNYAFGYLEKEIREEWVTSNYSITDRKSHEFKGYYLNGGLVWDLTPKLRMAAVFRTPFVKESDSESFLRYYSPDTSTDILIEAAGQSEYEQPFVAGLGAAYAISPRLRVASDLTFTNWSEYSIVYFDQDDELTRDFKDTLKAGAGIEYTATAQLFGQDLNVPFRAGLIHDPQPMVAPDSAYLYFSFGTGIQWKKLYLDLGMIIGKEGGSGNSLSAKKGTLSLSFKM
jgi:hypothetical protein